MTERQDDERYDLLVGAAARRALAERLPERIAVAVWAFCDGPLRADPYRLGKPLRPPFAGQYSARRGAYRVRYRIADAERVVTVVDISYRADAYGPGRA